MSEHEDLAVLRRSLIMIANGLTDRLTLVRGLVDELMTTLVQKGVFTAEESQDISGRALAEREKRRAEYALPDDKAAMDRMAHIQRALAADVVDLAAVRKLLEREP